MNKNDIIKYLRGDSNESEKKILLDWVNSSDANKKYFSQLKDLWIVSNMPDSKASVEAMNLADKIVSMPVSSYSTIDDNKITKNNKKLIINRLISFTVGVAAAVIVFFGVDSFRTPVVNTDNTEVLPLDRIELSATTSYNHTIYTNKGVKGFVALPDGSKVWLNSDSKLIFPDKFIGPTREVSISGEAYFDVVTNPDTPMVVNTNRDFMIKVYGTKFNVKTYLNDKSARTTLFSGKIDLLMKDKSGKDKLISSLNPKESFLLKDENRLRPVKANVDTLKLGAWRQGMLIFEATPMEDVIRELERWHGTQFSVLDPEIYKFKFSASFKEESLIQILEILKFCSDVDYTLLAGNKVNKKKKK